MRVIRAELAASLGSERFLREIVARRVGLPLSVATNTGVEAKQ